MRLADARGRRSPVAMNLQVQHRYILSCLELYETVDRVWVVMERNRGGELLELVTAPDADVGGAIKLLVSQPRTSSSRRTRAVAWHLEYDSGEDASARVLFHRAAQAGSPLLLAGAPLPPDVGDGA